MSAPIDDDRAEQLLKDLRDDNRITAEDRKAVYEWIIDTWARRDRAEVQCDTLERASRR